MSVFADFLIAEPPVAGLQRLRAGFSGHAYDRHRHETYAVGITEAGLQCFHYRGAAQASTAGRVIVIHPDEAHDGHAGAPGGFVYRMLYVDPALIGAALGGQALPVVGDPVFDDPPLRTILGDAFADFPESIGDLAAPGLIAALADALTRRAGSSSVTRRLPGKALDTARGLLDDAVGPVLAATLEDETGLDRYTLARSFRDRFGTSPHRYLVGRRLERVRAEIAHGASLADAAYAAGFADQSHMTRHFKARFGLPPAVTPRSRAAVTMPIKPNRAQPAHEPRSRVWAVPASCLKAWGRRAPGGSARKKSEFEAGRVLCQTQPAANYRQEAGFETVCFGSTTWTVLRYRRAPLSKTLF